MNTKKTCFRPRGFTLIELLVVITIIAVLAAMGFAGINIAIKKARTTQGLVAATGVAQAVESYYSDYNRLPDLQKESKTDSGDGVKLLQILLAQEGSGSDVDNPRQTVYLSLSEAKGKKNGLDYGAGGNSATVQGLYDPFGKPYTVVLNTNYDDALQFSFGGKQYTLRGKQVAVYSNGADDEAGTKDDITSWTK